MMQIVINIPEEVYKSIQNNDYCGISNADMYNAVKNGTPLPKGHRKSVDLDQMFHDYEDCANCALLKRLYVPPIEENQNIPKDAYVCTLCMNEPLGDSVMFKISKHGMCECFAEQKD